MKRLYQIPALRSAPIPETIPALCTVRSYQCSETLHNCRRPGARPICLAANHQAPARDRNPVDRHRDALLAQLAQSSRFLQLPPCGLSISEFISLRMRIAPLMTAVAVEAPGESCRDPYGLRRNGARCCTSWNGHSDLHYFVLLRVSASLLVSPFCAQCSQFPN